MNEKKRLIKNTGIIAVGKISTKLISFLLLPLYTALLSTSEYGTFDYILSIATFCVPFVSALMDESIFRFLIDCKTEFERKKVISTAVLIVGIGIMCFILIGIPAMNLLKYGYTYYVIAYIVFCVICEMLSALLRGIGRTDQYALFNYMVGASQILLNVLLIAVLKLGLTGMLLASILAKIGISVLFIIKLRVWQYVDFHIVERKLAREMIVYSLPLIPNKVSWTIINLSDRIILMNAIGSEATGLYAVSYKFPNLMDTVYGFFYQSWKESSARVVGNESQNDFYNSIYDYLKRFMFAIVLGMCAFMPLVFRIMINANYYEAIYYIPILLLGTYFANISGFYGGIFTAYKDTKIMGTTTVAAAIVNLVANWLMIRSFGIYAAALSTLIANFAVYFYRKLKMKKYIMLKENVISSIMAIVVTLVILGLFYYGTQIANIVSCVIVVFYAAVSNRKLLTRLITKIIHREFR